MSSDPGARADPAASPPAGQAPPGFDRPPFAIAPDADFLFWTTGHRRAAACLDRGIDGDSPVTLLTGEIGTGKTTLLQHCLVAPRPDLTIGSLSYFGTRAGDLSAWILLAFERAVPDGPVPLQVTALQSFVMAEHEAGRRCILILDEAQGASDEDLEALRQLTNLNTGRHMLLQVVLVGQPSLRTRLESERHAPLLSRIGADAHLSPMNRDETAGYVRHRLRCAGGPADLFTADALDMVHDVARGIARATNVLCELCVADAARTRRPLIDAPLVRGVIAEARRSGTFASLARRRREPEALPTFVRGTPAFRSDLRAQDGAAGAPAGTIPLRRGAERKPSPPLRLASVTTEGAAEDAQSSSSAPAAPPAANSPERVTVPAGAAKEPAGPADPPADAGPPNAAASRDDSETVRHLAYSAMASLADFEASPADRPPRRERPPPSAPATQLAGRRRADAPGPAPATTATRRRLRPLHLAAGAALAVGMMAIGSAAVLPDVTPSREAPPAAMPAGPSAPGARSDPGAWPAALRPSPRTRADAAPGHGARRSSE